MAGLSCFATPCELPSPGDTLFMGRHSTPRETLGGLVAINDDDISTTDNGKLEGTADGGANPEGHDGGADGSA